MNGGDVNWWKDALGVVMVLWNIGLTAAMWLRKPGIDAAQAVRRLSEDATRAIGELRGQVVGELADITNRVTAVETTMKHMPTSEELSDLKGMVQAINERTTAMNESIGTFKGQLSLIQQFLLNNKKG